MQKEILILIMKKICFTENDKKFWFEVFIFGGKEGTGIDAIQWVKEAEKLGAGEILLTSIDKDGTKDGYDILLTQKVVDSVSIPVIASGGCGKQMICFKFSRNQMLMLHLLHQFSTMKHMG